MYLFVVGMAGFARLCPGDVFEVSIRHGPQKWKTKGRIEKNNTQKWDQPEFIFKALVGEVLALKVCVLLTATYRAKTWLSFQA